MNCNFLECGDDIFFEDDVKEIKERIRKEYTEEFIQSMREEEIYQEIDILDMEHGYNWSFEAMTIASEELKQGGIKCISLKKITIK